ncbi:MAG: chemotaxis protein CheW, partial [Planctomycetota bacterium]
QAPPASSPPPAAAKASEPAAAGDGHKKSVADLSIRVNVEVLDSLMNLVGELVLTRNQLLQMTRSEEESKYAAPITHLNRVTTDLQEGVMKTRMQPIGNAWSKLPRLIRDLEQVTNKAIELNMAGAETELDRTVLDAIKDPLTHMIRNSADHGIESPEARRAAGKPEIGTINLDAFHEGGHVIIRIADDGGGIDPDKILRKALEKGVVSEAEAERLGPPEILQLIFKAGFSTAEQISSVSGRGVGMDVVRTAIERIGGTVDLDSRLGVGTTIRIKIPLTLAIISALVVEAGGESFAIPQLGVVELVRLAAEDRQKIEKIHDREVFRLRDRLLPLVHLDEVLGLDSAVDAMLEGDVNIVVTQVGDEQFGLIVSEVFDTEEIVVKPVGRLLKDLSIYQGTTILGDGRVIMILDVAGIASAVGGITNRQGGVRTEADASASGRTTTMLLFDVGETTMAVPLSLVARLEEFRQEEIEDSAEGIVVQYRESLLPLLSIGGASTRPAGEPSKPQPIIVFTEGRRSMGLMVDSIRDIREEQLVIERESQQPGVLGTAIINGRATDVIDTQYYVTRAAPDWFEGQASSEAARVLVVDDSMFFRQLVTTSLETDGAEVVAVDSADDALARVEHGDRFDVVVADLDMPGTDGFELARRMRERVGSRELPLLALTGLDLGRVTADATEAGFDRVLKKFNARELGRAVEELRDAAAAAGAVE